MGERFTLIGDVPTDTRAEFAADIEEGLRSAPRRIACRWLYDEKGSRIFEEICELKEYYPTRAETEILEVRSPRIVELVGSGVTCVELGSGNSIKTRLLIDAFLESTSELDYVSVDISPSAIRSGARDLLAAYEGLSVTGIAGEYRRGFEWMAANSEKKKLVLWLGSNIGNLDRPGGEAFLREIRRHMTRDDHLLMGVDLRKDKETLEAAYDDPGGVTARFNLNVLSRINAELGGDFDLDAFTHEVLYEVEAGRVVTNLVSLRDQRVRIAALEVEFEFTDGEHIHTEDSHKYSPGEIDELAARSGFERVEHWSDAGGRFSLELFSPGSTA
ncbi:MAG: L-histidine N(alpha)-methyltransferase [Planctomycetes bacterium]|nr:L-histidine N(alpha)-methyltransferase [Planctomycetota bacterium]